MKRNVFYILFAAVIAIIPACQKDNSDQTTILEDKVKPQVSSPCDSFSVKIDAQVWPDTSNLKANVSGGTAPYAYQWSTGAQTQEAFVTASGTYSVTVTDANGCTAITQTTINMVANPCAGFKSGIEVDSAALGLILRAVPNGGTAPYAYQWSTGATTQVVSATTSGTYTVTVTDVNGCTAVQQITVNLASGPCAGFTNSIEVDSAAVGLILRSKPNGGTVPYAYQWSTGATTQAVTVTTFGTYTVTATDANGCTAAKAFTY